MYFFQILLTSLVTGTQVLLLAAALYLVHTVTKTFHIALGAITIAGAYGFYVIAQDNTPFAICVLAGLIVAALLGLVSFFILHIFIKKGQYLFALIMSVTFSIALESGMGMIFGPEGTFLVNTILPTFDFWGLHITQVGVWTLIIGFFVAIVGYIFLYLLPYGRIVRAISQHRECASLVGIQERKVEIAVYVIAALLAGLVGILTGINDSITPTAGLNPIIMAFMALLVGGVNDFRGTVVSSYLLVLIPEFIVAQSYNNVSLSTSWKLVFVFIIALVTLIIRPNGILSPLIRKA